MFEQLHVKYPLFLNRNCFLDDFVCITVSWQPKKEPVITLWDTYSRSRWPFDLLLTKMNRMKSGFTSNVNYIQILVFLDLFLPNLFTQVHLKSGCYCCKLLYAHNICVILNALLQLTHFICHIQYLLTLQIKEIIPEIITTSLSTCYNSVFVIWIVREMTHWNVLRKSGRKCEILTRQDAMSALKWWGPPTDACMKVSFYHQSATQATWCAFRCGEELVS